jgi:hypothetical protein
MIVISPYARSHYIDHQQHDFGSITRYVEDTFGLPQLGPYDTHTNSIAKDLDYTQTPIQPTVLPQRACPAGANESASQLVGTVRRVQNETALRAIYVHTSTTNDLSEIVLSGRSQLVGSNHHTVPLTAVRYGDRITGSGVPTPDRALVYLGQTIQDKDVRAVHDLIGFVTARHPMRHAVTLHLSGNLSLTLNLHGAYGYRGPRGTEGWPALNVGDVVGVTGIINTRLHQFISGGPIRVYMSASTTKR